MNPLTDPKHWFGAVAFYSRKIWSMQNKHQIVYLFIYLFLFPRRSKTLHKRGRGRGDGQKGEERKGTEAQDGAQKGGAQEGGDQTGGCRGRRGRRSRHDGGEEEGPAGPVAEGQLRPGGVEAVLFEQRRGGELRLVLAAL